MNNNDKIKNILEFYKITTELKGIIRSGWKVWKADMERLESVAEHVYGCQMLAMAINSEFELGIDIIKVSFMLAIHEIGEAIIGDIPATVSTMTKAEKQKIELEAVEKILSPLNQCETIKKYYLEFEEKKTAEAKFAYLVDKLECDIQCKFYDEHNAFSMDVERPEKVRAKMELYESRGCKTLSSMFINYDIDTFYENEPVFKEIAQYVISNRIFKS
ncbi:MAG: HD domain-containing protein [Firmicutes bacterium]|nr:HD domain-containing protein [Bacillota bacterium]